jgi:hypothetical protein
MARLGWPLIRKAKENVQIRHNADATGRAKRLNIGGSEVSNVPRTEDIGLSVCGGVQDGIVIGIRDDERSDDHGLDHLGRVS